MSSAKLHLERALNAALAQYIETMGEAFSIVPLLDVVDDEGFWALAETDCGKFHIRVSSGTVNELTAFWESAFADPDFLAGFEQAVDASAIEMTHIGLVWLMLHEMHHFQMKHFEFFGPDHLTETHGTNRFGLVQRARKPSPPRSNMPKVDAEKVKLCLEMQADHDATEMLLDAYSCDEWISLRVRVAGISAMMMLIERADIRHQPSSATHPKATTRIFQLLGHLIDMPMISTHVNIGSISGRSFDVGQLLSKDEHQHFVAQVVVPTFFDAIALAKVAAAKSITDDLGNATDFFHDVKVAKLTVGTRADDLITTGARQWADLVGRNIKTSS